LSGFILIPIVFFTSCLTAIMGMGGGVLLIAVMPGLLPASAILPIHAATQLASNASRAAFGWRHIDLSIVPAFALGAVLGVAVGGSVYQSLDLTWLPAVIGVFILVLAWVRLPLVRRGGQFGLFALGCYQTGLGMVAGATGPLGAALLARRNSARDWLVVNTALYMSVNHLLRLAAFVLLGFSFAPWWPLVLGLVVASIVGSWVGSRLRGYVPQLNFERLFRWLVTLLAVRMIALPFLAAS
tara:strand:- start:193616 stop:194338 length:723 start_codon:yes stop_codon:yes gene_type:complete